MTEPFVVIDLSHHNGASYAKADGLPLEHFRELKRCGVEAGYFKVTEGTSMVDEDAGRHVAKARKVGMHVGLYHWALDGVDPEAQADWFLTHARAANGGTLDDLLLVVDAEWTTWAQAPHGPTIRQLGKALQQKAPRNVIALYTARGYIQGISNPQLADTYDLVINAAWDQQRHRCKDVNAPVLPPRTGYGGWKGRAKFCQIGPLHYTVDGKAHTVDLDLYYGSRARFDDLFETKKKPVKPPPDPDETPTDAPRFRQDYNDRLLLLRQAVVSVTAVMTDGGKEAQADVVDMLETLRIGG